MIKSIDKKIRSAKKGIRCSDCKTKATWLVTAGDGGREVKARSAYGAF